MNSKFIKKTPVVTPRDIENGQWAIIYQVLQDAQLALERFCLEKQTWLDAPIAISRCRASQGTLAEDSMHGSEIALNARYSENQDWEIAYKAICDSQTKFLENGYGHQSWLNAPRDIAGSRSRQLSSPISIGDFILPI